MKVIRLLAAALSACLALLAPGRLSAQETPAVAAAELLRVFLDCNAFCDFDHIRREITYVNWVRDRQDADVHLIVTSQDTGAGGDEFVLRYIGLRSFLNANDELRFTTQPTDTDDEIRRKQTQRLALGLARYAARGPVADRLQLRFSDPGGTAALPLQQTRDPWNLWVFEVGISGFVSGESQTKRNNLSGSFEASRVSETWKFQAEIEGSRSHRSDRLEEGVFKSRTANYRLGALLVRSLGSHWSLGFELTGLRSTRENYDLLVKAAPGIEYNVYPYRESSRRQFVFIYSLGMNYENYRDSTIFDKLKEVRPVHRLTLALEATQPWGELEAELQGSAYLDDFSKNRLSVEGRAEVRLVRGLDLNVFGIYARVRDQLSLAKAGASDEEILLQLRQLRTSYFYEISLGLSYTFGSKFNNTVNPRFNNSPGS